MTKIPIYFQSPQNFQRITHLGKQGLSVGPTHHASSQTPRAGHRERRSHSGVRGAPRKLPWTSWPQKARERTGQRKSCGHTPLGDKKHRVYKSSYHLPETPDKAMMERKETSAHNILLTEGKARWPAGKSKKIHSFFWCPPSELTGDTYWKPPVRSRVLKYLFTSSISGFPFKWC